LTAWSRILIDKLVVHTEVLNFLTHEDGTDRSSLNGGKELPPFAA